MSDPGHTGMAGDAQPADLGASLKAARIEKGLELSEVAGLTHVRREYLAALEEGRYKDLPEDVYTRNFVRLFAQAVGISPDHAISAYQSERKRAGGLSTLEMKLEQERRGDPPPRARRKQRAGGRLPRLGPLVPTVVLVAGLVALAVWGFNSLLFRPTTPRANQTTPAPAATGGANAGQNALPATVPGVVPTDAGTGTADPVTILVSVTSAPPGARVSIDGFVLPGVTPIFDAPVTARAGRVLSVSLDGYQPLTQSVDLLEPQTLHVELAAQSVAEVPGAAQTETAGPAAGAGQVALAIRASTWLEVYRGTTRMGGERLVYRTAEPGESFVFDLPVYVHVGNAAGIEVTLGDSVLGVMGSAGAVVGRAFAAQ